MYLYGSGGHSKVIRDIFQDIGIELIGVFDDKPSKENLKSSDLYSGIHELEAPLIISIGDNSTRAKIVAKLPDMVYGKAIHSTAIISPNSLIGCGTVIMQGAIVQASANIGNHVIVNTSASVDHDNVIGDFAHIAPHAALCGNVNVGEGTLIGVGALVIPSIRIGRWCKIGAGSVVIRDVPDFATVVGNPARVIKINDEPVNSIDINEESESFTLQAFTSLHVAINNLKDISMGITR